MKKAVIYCLVFISIFMLSSCFTTTYEYDDFSEHFLDSFASVYEQDDLYLVYFYSEYCSDCASVKQEVLGFLNDYETLEFYLISESFADDQFEFEDFYVTPTVFIIEDNEIIESYLGSPAIKEFINNN